MAFYTGYLAGDGLADYRHAGYVFGASTCRYYPGRWPANRFCTRSVAYVWGSATGCLPADRYHYSEWAAGNGALAARYATEGYVSGQPSEPTRELATG